MRHILAAALVFSGCAGAVADWPQFLGPGRSGISPDTAKLAKTWPASGPKVLWTVKVGPGFGGAAIVGNEVFLLDRENDQQDVLRCLDLADGKELWRFAYDAPGKVDHNGSRGSPAVDDKYVFTVGPFGDFHCVDRKTHKAVWRKNLVKDFAASQPTWAVAQSPLLCKDLVAVAPCGKDAGIVAIKKDSGEVAWQSDPCGGMQYVSAMPMKIDGVEQIAACGNTGKDATTVLSVDAATGKTLWKFDKWGCSTPIPSPMHVGDGKVFITGGYNAGSVMIQVRKKGAQWSVGELWRLGARECGSQIHNPLVWEGHLYIDNNENGKNLGMICLDMDGKVAWRSKNPNCNLGGQIIADGMIYKVDGSKGMLFLIEPTPESFKVVAQAKLLDGGEIWAPLAISSGKLVLRDQAQMKCLDVK